MTKISDVFRINGVNMPTPDFDGITVSYEPLWSSNAGRTGSGLYVGDIVDEKITLDITISGLTDKEVKVIETQLKNAFFTVTFPDPNDGSKSKTIECYKPPRSYPIRTIRKNSEQLNTVQLSFVER